MLDSISDSESEKETVPGRLKTFITWSEKNVFMIYAISLLKKCIICKQLLYLFALLLTYVVSGFSVQDFMESDTVNR